MSNSELLYVGEMSFKDSAKIRVQDPCYVKEDGTSYGHYELDLTEWGDGDHPVYIEIQDNRVKRLILGRTEGRCKDRYDSAFKWLADLPVDTGQMAFMNELVFHDKWDDDYDDEESDYRQICDLTIPGLAGCFPNGLVAASQSGYGDGCYPLTTHSAGDIFVITFFEDDEEEEDEYHVEKDPYEFDYYGEEDGWPQDDEFDEWLGVGY